MSEVDRLSNSGLYPVLRIDDKQTDKPPDKSGGNASGDAAANTNSPSSGARKPAVDRAVPRSPSSLLDEYA